MRSLAIYSAAALFGLSTVYSSALAPRAVVNGRCTGGAGNPGVCIPTTECTAGGGAFISGACPGTPDNVKCCTRTTCGSGGSCRWTDQCSGTSQSGLCPGPAGFQCCVPGTGGGSPGGGTSFPAPRVPAVGACKAAAVNGANAVIRQFPGKVREIGCVRDCPCPSDSEHCCGLAIDYMCSRAAGVRTEEGRAIAEWMMNNRGTLNLKYVIWGQRIWNPSRDSVKPWNEWRLQRAQNDNTLDHWDHVHASFN